MELRALQPERKKKPRAAVPAGLEAWSLGDGIAAPRASRHRPFGGRQGTKKPAAAAAGRAVSGLVPASDQIDGAVGLEGLRAVALVDQLLRLGEGQVPIGCHLGQGHPLALHRALLLSRSTRRPCKGSCARKGPVRRATLRPAYDHQSDQRRPPQRRSGDRSASRP